MEIYRFENIKIYLQLEHPVLMKDFFGATFFYLDVIALPTILIGNPSILIKAMLFPIIFINIFNLVIRFNLEKYQELYIL